MSKRTIRLWAIGRRIQYGLGFFLFWALIGTGVYFGFFYQPANCFDRIINGDETGVDCGGSCVRICAVDVIPPVIVWTKSFEIAEGQYNAVAYVENKNRVAATPELNYTFQLLNDGVVLAERSGKTVLPPNSVYPIFEGRIFTSSKVAATETNIILESAEMWIPASVGRTQFRSIDIELRGADDRPRLDVELENTELTAAENLEVVATIFSENGQPVTASQTFLERINARSTKDIVFTWPNSIAKTVKSCIIPTDVAVVIDLSGSMNNDGGTPPQPVTDALQAAGQFVNSLQENDQVSVITFATRASVITGLTGSHENVANTIVGLKIGAAEEVGYTNTAEALQKAQNELNSNKHNIDARRVLVLLTDGLPTVAGGADAVAESKLVATAISEDSIELYSIGLGQAVDQSFIKDIASDSSNAYFAPSGADLEKIYGEITSSLCEVGPTKIDIIAKTKTNFAPLR